MSGPTTVKRQIVVDTREQTPWTWQSWKKPPQLARAGLATGDYTLKDGEELLDWLISVERKNLDDFISCITSERKRFERELERMQETVRHPYVAIEGSFEDISQHRYTSMVLPQSVIGSVCAWELDYPRIKFQWLGDRAHAEAWCYRKFLAIERRLELTSQPEE